MPGPLHAGRARGADRRGRAHVGRGDGRLSRRGLRLRLRVRRPAPRRTRHRRSGPGVCRAPPGTAFIGDGATRYREEIRAAVPDALFPARSAFLAGTLGLLAEPVLAAGGGVAPAELRPLYLRGTGARPGMTSAPLALEEATLEDLAALVALEARCHTHPWSERGLRDAVAPAAGAGAVLVLRGPWPARDEDRGIRAYCAYQVVVDEAHIHNLAVVPEARRHGSRAPSARAHPRDRGRQGRAHGPSGGPRRQRRRPRALSRHGVPRGGEAAGVLFGAGRGRGPAFPLRPRNREP